MTSGRPPAAVRIWILAVAFALLLAGTAQAVPRSFFGVVPQAPLTADDFTRDVKFLR